MVGKLFVQSYFGLDATLWRNEAPTTFLAEFEEQLARIDNLRLVFVDNAALVYVGDENDRGEVTQFINALNGLAARLQVGLILTTHSSKSSDGSTLRAASGSTAWINACRSVLRLETDEDDKATLTLIKANHTKPGKVIDLVWQDGVLIKVSEPDSFTRRSQQRSLDKVIFQQVSETWQSGNPLSSRTQATDRYLPAKIARTTDFKRKDIATAMLTLMDGGHLVLAREKSKSPLGLRIAKYTLWWDHPENGGAENGS